MKVMCPECKGDDFDPDQYGDDQYYYCKKCHAEIKVLTTEEGILTRAQKEFLTE